MILVGLGCSSAADSTKQAPPRKQVWIDDFNGSGVGSINTRYWEFNTGRGIFGTGEVETNTSSLYNVHQDGHGNLDLIVLGRGWAVRPIPRLSWRAARRYMAQLPTQIEPPFRARAVWIER